MGGQEQVVAFADKNEIARLVAAAKELGEADAYDGKREQVRVTDGLQLEVRTNLAGPSAAVSMQNVSDGGFAFWSKTKMFQRDTLFVRQFSEDNACPWLPAQVTHCTVGIRGFLIGAAFIVEDAAS